MSSRHALAPKRGSELRDRDLPSRSFISIRAVREIRGYPLRDLRVLRSKMQSPFPKISNNRHTPKSVFIRVHPWLKFM